MVVALLNSLGLVDDIRETQETDVSAYTNVKPLVSDPAPAHDELTEKIVPNYVVGPVNVTRTWTVVPLDAADLANIDRSAENVIKPFRFAPPEKSPFQASLGGKSVFVVGPSSGTAAPTVLGGTLTTAATMSFQVSASANKWLGTPRKRFSTSTTAGNASGMRTAYGQWFRGASSGSGGFFFRAKVGMGTNLNGGQKFVGLCASTGALAGDPSALTNMCGIGYDAADASTGNWFLMANDGAGIATKLDLGVEAARSTTNGIDLVIFVPASANRLEARVFNINTGQKIYEGSYASNIPAASALLAFKAEVRNGSVAAVDSLDVASVYIENT